MQFHISLDPAASGRFKETLTPKVKSIVSGIALSYPLYFFQQIPASIVVF